jgi:hypothetical protein
MTGLQSDQKVDEQQSMEFPSVFKKYMKKVRDNTGAGS